MSEIDYEWMLRALLAEHGVHSYAELTPLLAEHGVSLRSPRSGGSSPASPSG